MGKVRQIAANYIYLPGFPLAKNSYVRFGDLQKIQLVDTGGQLKEIEGLEFYGGLIVPEYMYACESSFILEKDLLLQLDDLFLQKGNEYIGFAIIEGADLQKMEWKSTAKIRLL